MNENLKKIYVYAFYVFSSSFIHDPLNGAFCSSYVEENDHYYRFDVFVDVYDVGHKNETLTLI